MPQTYVSFDAEYDRSLESAIETAFLEFRREFPDHSVTSVRADDDPNGNVEVTLRSSQTE